MGAQDSLGHACCQHTHSGMRKARQHAREPNMFNSKHIELSLSVLRAHKAYRQVHGTAAITPAQAGQGKQEPRS
jgi:hypothetical protein